MPYIEDDPFAFEDDAGGLKDDYDGTVLTAGFERPPNYNNGQTTCLVLTVQADDSDKPFTMIYPCGPLWASYDAGKTVQHPEGKKNFHPNTAVAELTRRAFDSGANDELRGRGKSSGIGPRDSSIWPGLRFHWNITTNTFRMKDRDNPSGETREITTRRTYPTQYLGLSSESAAPVELQVFLTGGGHSVQIPASLAEKVRAHANAKGFSDWQDAVMSLDGAMTNPALGQALSNPAFYEGIKE